VKRTSNIERIHGPTCEKATGCRCRFCRMSRSAKAAAVVSTLLPKGKRVGWATSGKRGSLGSAIHEVAKKPKLKSRRKARKQHPRNRA